VRTPAAARHRPRARGIVDFLEAVEIKQQQRGRAAIGDRPREEPLAEIEEGAAVGDAGKWIGERGLPLLQLRAFLRHGDAQEWQAEIDE
jgi:hypothetical protein